VTRRFSLPERTPDNPVRVRIAFRSLLAALALTNLQAQAVEMNGCFRDSTGFNSKGGSMACFQLPGSYFKAHLGTSKNGMSYGAQAEIWF
jgi:maltoporin